MQGTEREKERQAPHIVMATLVYHWDSDMFGEEAQSAVYLLGAWSPGLSLPFGRSEKAQNFKHDL